MAITITESDIIVAVKKHIQDAERNDKRGYSFKKNLAAADTILALAELAAGIKVRKAISINGLNKRLNSLIGGGMCNG